MRGIVTFAAAAFALSLATALPAAGESAMQGMNMPGMRMTPVGKPMPGMSIYNLTGAWTAQNDAPLPPSSLRGKPVVAAMVYTHCTDVCPLIAERMGEIEARLPATLRGSVRFVLFSLDWARDTPAQLRLFATQHHLDPKWLLLHGDEASVREMAAALGVSFHRDANGDFQHAIAIFVLDADGVVASEESDLSQAPKTIPAVIVRLKSKKN